MARIDAQEAVEAVLLTCVISIALIVAALVFGGLITTHETGAPAVGRSGGPS